MKKELLICGCAIVGGLLGGKLISKCIKKATKNKSEEVKKIVDTVVETTLVSTGVVMTVYAINKRIDAVNSNTELCFVANVLNANMTDDEKVETLKLLKTKFISHKALNLIDSIIDKLAEVK